MIIKAIKGNLILKLLIVATLSLSFASCNSTTTCSDSTSSSDPSCQSQIPKVSQVPVSLSVTFANSYFYDQNSASWMTVTAGMLAGGSFGITVPIYSDFLNLDQTTVIQQNLIATDQFNRQSVYTPASYNEVPYIEILPQAGAQYLYDYVKKDLNNNVIYEMNGIVPVVNGRVILPLINAMFNNNFYSANSAQGSRFVHTITFAAQSQNQKGSLSTPVEFQTAFESPSTSFAVDYTGDMQNYSLDNRWTHYYQTTDGNANGSLKFFTLKDKKTTPEQVPLDFKVVFQTPPSISIDETVFFELPFDFTTFQTTNTIVPLRGSSFYSKTETLTSNTDFGMNIKVNGVTIPITNTKEVEYDGLPAGTPWNVEFDYNMNQNAGYSSTSGRPLLTPLKPICVEQANQIYTPIATETAKATAIANNGYISICHPVYNKEVVVPAGATGIDLIDSWFNYFSYVAYNPFKNELGMFSGIKSVLFHSSGCFRVYSREIGTSSFILKSIGSPQCGASTNGQDTGWVYYNSQQLFTVFDNITNYNSISGLVPLLQTFSSRPTQTNYPIFKFNGIVNDTHHIF